MHPEKLLPFKEVLPFLKNVTIFAGLTDDNIRQIYNESSLLEGKVGDVLLQEGTPATEILIILRGRVTVVLNLQKNPLELREFGPGDCVGEASVIGIQNHSASVVVMQDATLVVLSRKILMELFEKDKGVFSLLILNIARELARRLHYTNDVLLQYGKGSHDHSAAGDPTKK